MIRTYRYRIYPNKTHRDLLGNIFDFQCTLYNQALHNRTETYKTTKKSLSYVDQWNIFKQARRDVFPHVNATSMQQLLRRLDKSFKAFFRRIKSGKKSGFPRFKPRNRFHSIEFKPSDGCKIASVDGKQKLSVTHVGLIRIKWHRDLPDDSVIKHIVISNKHGKWFVCLQFEIPDSEKVSDDPAIGIDLGINHLVATSDGDFIDSPKHYIASQRKFRILQRSVSRKKRGSNRRKESVRLLGKQHEHIANCRDDFLHKTTRKLVDNYGIIAIEKLTLAFMTKDKFIAKSAHDVAIGKFTSMLEYKAEEAGVQVVKVDPKNTSQLCSQCNKIVKKDRGVRVHKCPHCGLILDRDINAAKNILQRAASVLEPLTCRITESVGSQAVCFS